MLSLFIIERLKQVTICYLLGVMVAFAPSAWAEPLAPPARDPVLKKFYQIVLDIAQEDQGRITYKDQDHRINLSKLTENDARMLSMMPRSERGKGFMVYRYISNTYRSGSDLFLPVPRKNFWYLARPGDTVLLSDGITHHYTFIHGIDRRAQTIDLADLWPDRIFLRDGLNAAGVAATLIPGSGGRQACADPA